MCLEVISWKRSNVFFTDYLIQDFPGVFYDDKINKEFVYYLDLNDEFIAQKLPYSDKSRRVFAILVESDILRECTIKPGDGSIAYTVVR